MKVSDLKPAEYNPRKITDEKLSMLAKAMKEFGDLSGVIFNRKTGNLIGGHQRVKNLDPEWEVVKKPFKDTLGTVAQGYIDTPFGQWVYREVEWNKKKEAAANVAANQHGGEFDLPKLGDIITSLNDGAFDMDLLGFNDGELEALLADIGPTEDLTDAEPQIDQAEELNKKWQVKSGDLFGIGAYCKCPKCGKEQDL